MRELTGFESFSLVYLCLGCHVSLSDGMVLDTWEELDTLSENAVFT